MGLSPVDSSYASRRWIGQTTDIVHFRIHGRQRDPRLADQESARVKKERDGRQHRDHDEIRAQADRRTDPDANAREDQGSKRKVKRCERPLEQSRPARSLDQLYRDKGSFAFRSGRPLNLQGLHFPRQLANTVEKQAETIGCRRDQRAAR